MPGVLPLHTAFTHSLRVALRYSRFTEELQRYIQEDATFVRSHQDPLRDSTYIVKTQDGKNVVKFWKNADDIERFKRYDRYTQILRHGMKTQMPNYYHATKDQPDKQGIYQAHNLVLTISQAITDLTVGGGVEIKTGMQNMDVLLNDDMRLGERIYDWLFEASVFGFVGVQVVCDEQAGTLEVSRILPHNLYPKFSASQDNEIVSVSKKIYIPRMNIADWQKVARFVKGSFDGFILEERHFRGYYENYLFAVSGSKIVGDVPLAYYNPDMKPVVLTGLQDFAITIIPNIVRLGTFKSDWDEILDLNLSFNDRASRESELLNKYAGPNLMVSDRTVSYDPTTGKAFYNVPREGVIAVRAQDNFTPSYLQPQADIQGSSSNRDFQLDMIAIESATAPILLNAEAAKQVQSGVSYKLHLTPTLNKSNRRSGHQSQAIERVVFNILSAIDYYSDNKLAEGYMEVAANSADPKEQQKAQWLQKYIKAHKTVIMLDSFEDLFRQVEVLHDTPMGLFIEDPKLAKTTDELQFLATQDQLQYIDDRNVAMSAIIRLKEIDVRMTPSLPQDMSTAIDRLGNKSSMSVQRFLKDIDHMSDEEVLKELALIQEEEETMTPASDFAGFGGTPIGGEQPSVSDVGYGLNGPQSVNAGVAVGMGEGSSDVAMTA